jgi:hypothetical protein
MEQEQRQGRSGGRGGLSGGGGGGRFLGKVRKGMPWIRRCTDGDR